MIERIKTVVADLERALRLSPSPITNDEKLRERDAAILAAQWLLTDLETRERQIAVTAEILLGTKLFGDGDSREIAADIVDALIKERKT